MELLPNETSTSTTSTTYSSTTNTTTTTSSTITGDMKYVARNRKNGTNATIAALPSKVVTRKFYDAESIDKFLLRVNSTLSKLQTAYYKYKYMYEFEISWSLARNPSRFRTTTACPSVGQSAESQEQTQLGLTEQNITIVEIPQKETIIVDEGQAKVNDQASFAIRRLTYMVLVLFVLLVFSLGGLAYIAALYRNIKAENDMRKRGIQPAGKRTVMAVQVREGAPLVTLAE